MEKYSKEYHRLHYSLRTKHGKANRCDFKDTCNQKSKAYGWALKKGNNYSDNPNDYYQLCKSCHSKYDYKGGFKMSDETKDVHRQRMTGKEPPNKGNYSRVKKTCKYCKEIYREYNGKRKTYCSVDCRNKDMIGKQTRNKNGRKGKNGA